MTVKALPLLALAATVLSACGETQTTALPSEPAQDDIEAARAAAGALGAELFAALSQALAEEGPESAIAVCNEAAPAIAASLGDAHGMKVARTALRVRNPANAADPWERAQLEAFQARFDEGEAFADMEAADITVEDDVRTFRWMKPIAMGAPCAACHGEAIAPSTLAAINALYPEDEATGFTPGALRGAFTMRKALSD